MISNKWMLPWLGDGPDGFPIPDLPWMLLPIAVVLIVGLWVERRNKKS